MAIKIVTRILGKIVPADRGYTVKIAGREPKTFSNKEDAEKHLDKYGPRRYYAGLWANKKLKWKKFTNKKAAEDYLHRRNVDISDGNYREIRKASFAEYAAKWEGKHLLDLKPSTTKGYRSALAYHFIPRFGPMPMQAIHTDDITDFLTDCRKAGQAPKSVMNLRNLLSRFFGDAEEDKYIQNSPMPTRRHRGPSSKADRKGRALTYAQAAKLLETCDANLKLVVLLGLLAGLRRGEIFALHVQDIDWDENVIHVRRSLFWAYGKYQDLPKGERKFIIDKPKSEQSIRDVDLSPALKTELWNRYMDMKMADRTGLLFQTANATPFDPQNVYRREFQPALERVREKADKEEDEETYAAFDRLRLHDLRHTFGSWKIAEGQDIVYVSKQMGHSKVSITADIYAHLLEKRRPAATARTDEHLFGKAVAKD